MTVGVEATLLPESSRDQPELVDPDSIAVGNVAERVLRALGNTIDEMPSVSLRESADDGDDPIQRPNSPEIPHSQPDGRYQLQGEIARGGMGAVIKGRDTDLGRDLAIKVLLDSHKDNPQVIQRFIEEAQIGGQLQHPGIAPVYELGQFADQRPFFSMKLVKGQTLSKLMLDRTDATSERGRFVGIFQDICQTMAYAHSRGVIHRDLKPANIMVGAFGEVQVMDWGLAKVLPAGGVADERKVRDAQQADSIIQTMRRGIGSIGSDAVGSTGSDTQVGSVMGTPAYMPPEQALGEVDMMDERADVFGLGAILCELLTGQPAYVAENGMQVFRLAAHAKLDDCFERLDGCGADDVLVNLTKQCLEPEPGDRPRNASVLAQRVTDYLESVETKLREVEVERAAAAARADAEAAQAAAERQRAEAESARASEENRRRKTSLALAASVLLFVAAGAGGWLYMLRNEADAQRTHAVQMQTLAQQRDDQRKAAEQLTDVAEMAKQEALAAEEKGRQLLYATDMQLVSNLLKAESPNGHQIISHLNAHDPESPQNLTGGQDQRGFEWHYYEQLVKSQAKIFAGFKRPVIDFAVTSEGDLVTLDDGAWVQRFDLETQEPKRAALNLGRNRNVGAMALSQDGRRVALAIDEEVHQFDSATGEPVGPVIRAKTWRNGLLFSPDGKMLVTVDSGVGWWDAETGDPIAFEDFGLNFPTWYNTPPALSSDGLTLVVGGRSSEGIAASGFRVLELNPETAEINRKLNIGGGSGKKQFVTISPDGEYVASSRSFDQRIQIFQASSGKQLQSFTKAHSSAILRIAFNPGGTQVVTGASNGTIKVWKDFQKLEDYQKLAQEGSANSDVTNLLGHTEPISAMHFVAGGKHFVSAGEDMTVRVWNLKDWKGSQYQTFAGTKGKRAEFSPDGTLLAVSGSRGGVSIRDAATGQVLAEFRERREKNVAFSVAFSPDNRLIAIGYAGGDNLAEIELWDIDDQQRTAVMSTAVPGINGGKCRVSGLAFSPDGDSLVASLVTIDSVGADTSFSFPVLVYETASGTLRHRLQGHYNSCYSVAFSPDGSRMASCSFDGTARIWDCATWRELHVLKNPFLARPGQGRRVFDVAFSPDGSMLAMASNLGRVILWDVDSGTTLQILRAGANPIQAVTFSLDGRTLALAATDGTVWLYKTSTWRELTTLQGNAPITSLSFSPDGNRLLSASSRNAVIWSTEPTEDATLIKPQQLIALRNSKADFQKRIALLSANPRLHESLSQLPAEELADESVQSALAAARTSWHALNQRPREAMIQYDQLRKLSNDRPQDWFHAVGMFPIANVLLDEGRSNEASEFVITAARQMKMGRVKLADVKDHFDNLQGSVNQKLAESPQDQHLLTLRAELLGMTGNTKQQIADYTTVIASLEKEPASRVAADLQRLHQRRGDALLQMKKWQQASDDYAIGMTAPTSDRSLLANQALARANVLLEQLPKRVPLKLIDQQSKNGSEFSVQDDNSILVTGGKATDDSYELLVETDLKTITAIGVEALTDESLPSSGPGRGRRGAFVMNWTVEYASQAEPDRMKPLNFSTAVADYFWAKSPLTTDHWHGEGGSRQPHQAWFQCAEPLQSDSGFVFKLKIRGSADRGLRNQILGRFRLSISGDPEVVRIGRKSYAARKLTDPWTKLAAAYHFHGDQSNLEKLLKQHFYTARELANFFQQLGDWETAIEYHSKLIANEPSDAALYIQRAATYIDSEKWGLAEKDWARAVELQPENAESAFALFRKTDRWKAAAQFGKQMVEQNPDSSALQWLEVSPFVAMADDESAYTDFCRRITKRFEGSQSLHDVDCVVKASLLRPRDSIECNELANYFESQLDASNARDALFRYWSTRGLLAYRRGDTKQVIQYVAKSEESNPHKKAHALNMSLLAIAHFQLQQPDQAKAALLEAKQLTKNLEKAKWNVGEPNTMFATIILREAEACLAETDSPAVP